MIAGKLADALGRKMALFICAFLFAATGVGVTLAESLTVFIAFRIAGGIAVGAAAMVVPMYIAETVRGFLSRQDGSLIPISYRTRNSAGVRGKLQPFGYRRR
jgi:MFS family permease